MKCPYCGNNCPDEALYCDVCKQPLPTGGDADGEGREKRRAPRTRTQRLLLVLGWIVCLAIIGVGAGQLVFWIDSYKITRLYTRGAYTPTLSQLTLSDGRSAHALVFYGKDGDMIYVPELNRSLTICGGIARA